MSVVQQQDRRKIFAVRGNELLLGRLSLKGGKSQASAAIPLDQEVDEAIAEMTDSVKKNDCLWLSWIGHRMIV